MSKSTLAALLDRDRNNIDLVRLIAALAVVCGHAPLSTSPISAFTRLEFSGSIGVYAFFLLSGFLISASFDRQRSALKFVALRVARLWPGLIANILICALLIGPLFSSLTIGEYFRDESLSRFIAHNIGLLDGLSFSLPGVFPNGRPVGAMNYPLWTLPVEVDCYMIVLVFGMFRLNRRMWSWLAGCAAVFCAFMVATKHPPALPMFEHAFRIMGGYSFYPAAFFMLGMALYAVRDHVIIDRRLAVGLAIAYLLTRETFAGTAVFYAMLVYGILAFATSPELVRFRPANDYSYGIYIYGFVCKQIGVTIFPRLIGYPSLVIAIPLTLVTAAASWHLIEKPALKAFRLILLRSRGTPSSRSRYTGIS